MTQALSREPEQLRHSWVYYLIFPPDTASLYRASCIKISASSALGGIGFGILFSLVFLISVFQPQPPLWLFATGLSLIAATVVLGILTLIVARRSQSLDRATVHFTSAQNYFTLAISAYIAILLWPIWITVVFWAPLLVRFHHRGLQLLKAA